MSNIMEYTAGYLIELYTVFMDMAPYFFLGLTVAGTLHVFMKREFIARHLRKDNFVSVLKGALFGVPMPLCSCGVVPAALSLRKSGASEGASVAFLISTPQTGLDSIVATYGLLGMVFAAYTPFATFFTGIAGGALTLLWRGKARQEMTSSLSSECNLCFATGKHRHTLAEKVLAIAKYAYRDFLDDISVQLMFGIVLSAVIAFAVPDDFFSRYISSDFLSMLLMALVGIPLYVCATASLPIALAFIDKGISPGAALVFLTVGPATNAASIMLIASVMGKRVAAIHVSSVAVMAFINGYILNFIFEATGAPLPVIGHVGEGHSHGSYLESVPVLLAAVFALILAASLFRRARETAAPALARIFSGTVQPGGKGPPAEHILIIEGMTCERCRSRVLSALKNVPGVGDVHVDLEAHTATIQGSTFRTELVKAVEKAGFSVKG
ncbi:MAG: SO_0444 family Cu/Zn efflux transporter [Chitinispirillaceae bacterium]|nr:SO_0444 family Cu/Zn efflux transporter [Chitinispirillaceae bacterium]